MTDEEVEGIIKSNMNLQMNLAGIRADFEEKLQRTWVGLTEQEQGAIMEDLNAHGTNLYPFAQAVEAKLKEKNT